MTLCFIADFRSTIARNWIGYFAGRHRVHVLTTQPAAPMEGVALHNLTPGSPDDRQASKQRWAALMDPGQFAGRALSQLHHRWWLPVAALRAAATARRWIEQIEPELVHSLRIPIEGEIGGRACGRFPHLISAWGNDFTLYAEQSTAHAWLTRRAVAGCAGFLADARVDVERAKRHGLARTAPTLVVPGAGGVNTSVFHAVLEPGHVWSGELSPLNRLPAQTRLIVNARGFRTYVRNDNFFRAAAGVAARQPDVHFVAVGLRRWGPAEDLVRQLRLTDRVLLTGPLSALELAELHRRSAVMVSPTEHDGTPNTLLEAMACGALPVCGDLPSLREWIVPGENGLLTRVDRPEPLEAAMLQALADASLAARARRLNPRIIAERAAYGRSMAQAEEFYGRIVAGAGAGRAAGQTRITVGRESEKEMALASAGVSETNSEVEV